MSNDEVYAAGLLNAALDPAFQPPEIRSFLQTEQELLAEIVRPRSRVVDFGCGTGRHLRGLSVPLALSVGFDYERSYIAEATALARGSDLAFFVADAAAVPLRSGFDLAICMTNTWGTMEDKLGVLAEMRRLAPVPGSRVISVYAADSVEPRCQWYANLGHEVNDVFDDRIVTAGGFVSEHFTEDRLRSLVGDCELLSINGLAWLVRA